MAITVTHTTQATGTNDGTKQVSVNAWNEGHTITGAMENPMTTAGDVITGGASGAPQRLAVGTDGQVLKVVSGVPAWATDAGGMTNPMTTQGDVIVGGTSGTPERLAKGADGQVLKMVSGAPAWSTDSTGAGGGMENPMTTAGDIIVGVSTGTPVRLGVGTDGQVLKVVSGAPAWGAAGASGGLTNATGTDADTTMAVGNMYVVDMSAWATADRTYTLPATAAAGDQIGVMVTAGNATYELILKPDAADTINGGSAGAEWSRIFITGEVVIFRCVAANSGWVVEYDGRIPCTLIMRLTTGASAEVAATQTIPTDKSGVWTADVNVGACGTPADGKFTFRRAGTVSVMSKGNNTNTITAAKYTDINVWDGTTGVAHNKVYLGATGGAVLTCSGMAYRTAGNYLQLRYATEEGSKGLGTLTNFCCTEIL